MNLIKLKSNAIYLILLITTACSAYYTSNGGDNYLSSRSGPVLVVPAPLVTTNLSHFYDLPLQIKDARVSCKPPLLGTPDGNQK